MFARSRSHHEHDRGVHEKPHISPPSPIQPRRSQPSFLTVPAEPSPVFSPDILATANAAAALATGASLSSRSSSPSQLEIRREPSLSRIDPLARVFPRPPPDDHPPPTIRPGSVRSVSFDRKQGESPDDDRASRHSNRSRSASVRGAIPPMPPLPKDMVSMQSTKAPNSFRTRKDDMHLEAEDRVGALPASSTSANASGGSVGVIGSFDQRLNRSVMSLGAKAKAETLLDMDPQPRLASLYLVSGLGKDPSQWALSDKDSILGVQPLEDSLGVFWRPDMLGSTFSGEKSEDWGKKGSQRGNSNPVRRDATTRAVPGAGPEGASRLVARTMKYAHPKDLEVVNSTLAPPTTCHTFTFNVSRQSTLVAMSSQRQSAVDTDFKPPGAVPPAGQEQLRGTTSSSDLVFYGVTLTIWSHADKDRSTKLKDFKLRRIRADSALSETAAKERAARRRGKTPWLPMAAKRTGGASDYTASETGMSDSDLDTTFTATELDYSMGDVSPAYGGDCDVFWLPYALTIVSRYPIYDVMTDYLRLSWARYSKDARAHMRQIFTLLNSEAPRPGDLFRLPIGSNSEDEVTIEATLPGALDFDKGTIKVDFQLWPLFQALDIDHIMICVDVALTNSGRIIFCSRHPAMLGTAVETLKYIVELRGWDGLALPNIHARDTTFLIEDPGPYIIGIATECRYVITPPPEVVIVDLDMNTLTCKALPVGVTPRHKREKKRTQLLAAFGPDYPSEKSIPTEYRVSFPKGAFCNIHRIHHGPARPRYLAERMAVPQWWNQNGVVAVFDKILADKHKKPSLFQRLTKAGAARAQQQLTTNERIAKAMMRKRALHYVEKRDDFELKVARITRRLQKLVQEGEQWKQRFETFEKYAERLSREAEDLKGKIDREHKEARRLSNINTEQEKVNAELQEKLVQTETARAEAMRQLSDMHHSIQELERERNEIMDIIEMQITNALQNLPYLDLDDSTTHSCETGPAGENQSQPTSPKTEDSTPASADSHRRKIRPATRDSTQSNFTINSSGKPMSVIGALHDGSVRRGLGSIVDVDQISHADRILNMTRSSSVNQRVAVIQAKLELALAPVQQFVDSQSDEAVVDDEEGDDDEQPTPVPKTHPPSGEVSPEPYATSVAVTAPSDDGSNTDDSGSDSPPQTDQRAETPTRRDPPREVKPRPHTFRSVVLRPPPRRVTQKKSYESIDSVASATSENKRDSLTPRSSNREIILTPVESIDSFRSCDDDRTRKETQLHADDRPASVISTSTITFGG